MGLPALIAIGLSGAGSQVQARKGLGSHLGLLNALALDLIREQVNTLICQSGFAVTANRIPVPLAMRLDPDRVITQPFPEELS